MEAWLRSWWQQIKKHPYATGIIVVLFVLIVFSIGVIKFGWDWTGFNGGYSKITIHTPAKDIELPPVRTLWDLLQLLFVPALLTLGAVWFTSKQTHDLLIAENQRNADRELAQDKYREDTLQNYIDKMSELLLDKDLLHGPPNTEVRNIARVRTLTVLPLLDKERKRVLLLFLHESGLILTNNPIIDLLKANLKDVALDGANLTKADLHGAILWNADLSGADLSGADLSGADLSEASLFRANLKGADLSEAFLIHVNLSDSDLTGANLAKTHLGNADFQDANLAGANLTGAHINLAIDSGGDVVGLGYPFTYEGMDLMSKAKFSQGNSYALKEIRKGATAIGPPSQEDITITLEELEQKAKSLKGATMPDGSKHP